MFSFSFSCIPNSVFARDLIVFSFCETRGNPVKRGEKDRKGRGPDGPSSKAKEHWDLSKVFHAVSSRCLARDV